MVSKARETLATLLSLFRQNGLSGITMAPLAPIVKQPHPVFLRYLAPLISVLAALSLTLSARSLFSTTSYALFLAAVMFSSWYGGLTPALIAILFSILALDRYLASPELSRVLSRD